MTHDVEEALRLGDQIVVMRDGQIVQHGTPLSVLTQPANAFVHNLLGTDDIVRRLGLIRVEEVMTGTAARRQMGRPRRLRGTNTCVMPSRSCLAMGEPRLQLPTGPIS